MLNHNSQAFTSRREECQKVSDKQVENKDWHTKGQKGLVMSSPTDKANEQNHRIKQQIRNFE